MTTSAAAVPYRVRKGRVEIALVTSRARGRWILPKGRIERGESSRVCAVRETHEEAGLIGAVTHKAVCTWWRRDGERIVVHLLHVKKVAEDWPERRQRRRRWVTLAKWRRLVRGRRLETVFVKVRSALEDVEKRRGAA